MVLLVCLSICGLIVRKNKSYWSGLFRVVWLLVFVSTRGKLYIVNNNNLRGDGPGEGRIPLFYGILCPQPGTIRDRGREGVE